MELMQVVERQRRLMAGLLIVLGIGMQSRGCARGSGSTKLVEDESGRGAAGDIAPSAQMQDAQMQDAQMQDAQMQDAQMQDARDGAVSRGGTPRMCDGSLDLRLAVRTQSGGLLPSELLREIGVNYLYVRGDCQYWALKHVPNPAGALSRTGTLTPAEERELADDIGYQMFEELKGVYATPSDGETNQLIFFDGTSSIWCEDGCYDGHPTAPEPLQRMGENAKRWWSRLSEAGEILQGPVRVVVMKSADVTSEPDPCVPEWPFSLEPESAVVSGENAMAGQSTLISNLEEARELRSWWLTYRNDPGSCQALTVLGAEFTATDPTTHYRLWVRDSLPLENSDGLILIPQR